MTISEVGVSCFLDLTATGKISNQLTMERTYVELTMDSLFLQRFAKYSSIFFLSPSLYKKSQVSHLLLTWQTCDFFYSLIHFITINSTFCKHSLSNHHLNRYTNCLNHPKFQHIQAYLLLLTIEFHFLYPTHSYHSN